MADYKVFGFLWKKIRRALHLKVKSEGNLYIIGHLGDMFMQQSENCKFNK